MGLSIDRISILSFLIMMMSGRGFVFLEHSSLRADFKDFSFSGKSFKFVLLSLRIECVFSIDFFLTFAIYRRVGQRIKSENQLDKSDVLVFCRFVHKVQTLSAFNWCPKSNQMSEKRFMFQNFQRCFLTNLSNSFFCLYRLNAPFHCLSWAELAQLAPVCYLSADFLSGRSGSAEIYSCLLNISLNIFPTFQYVHSFLINFSVESHWS